MKLAFDLIGYDGVHYVEVRFKQDFADRAFKSVHYSEFLPCRGLFTATITLLDLKACTNRGSAISPFNAQFNSISDGLAFVRGNTSKKTFSLNLYFPVLAQSC